MDGGGLVGDGGGLVGDGGGLMPCVAKSLQLPANCNHLDSGALVNAACDTIATNCRDGQGCDMIQTMWANAGKLSSRKERR
jgi:hypothetical protein